MTLGILAGVNAAAVNPHVDPTAALPGSVDQMHALQLERLRGTVRHAYANVAHYRQVGMPPVSIPTT